MKKMSMIIAFITAATVLASCGTTSQVTVQDTSEGTSAQTASSEEEVQEESQQTSQENITPLLVKSFTVYEKAYDTNEWEQTSKTEYTYENNYPVKIDKYENVSETHFIRTFEYTFENDLPATRKEYNEQSQLTATTEYNNGRVYEINAIGSIDGSGSRLMFQYADDGPYFTAVLSITTEPNYTMEEIDAIQIATKDGLMEKTSNCGLYANWNNGEEKQWERFNGTYTAIYDSDGLIKRTDDVFRAGPQGGFDFYDVVKEDGKITEVYLSHTYEDQKTEELKKITFEYEDFEIDKVRYATMMNECMAGEGNNYYKYNWY